MQKGTNLTRAEALGRAALISDVHYDVTLDVTSGPETFVCNTVVTFRSSSEGASTFLDFLAPSVDRAELNGDALPSDAFDGGRLQLTGLRAENELRVTGTCSYEHTGSGLHHFADPVDGAVYLHTQFEPFDAHRVYPCFDQPDIKATFRLAVEAPAGWTAISNTAAVARPPEGAAGRWLFDRTPLVPTYITALVAGPYHLVEDRHGDIDLGLYCRQSLAQYLDSDEIFETTKQGLDFYIEAFGYPYPFGKYDQLFVPEFSAGAMENAGCVTFHESFVFRSKVTEAARERRAEVILHEMAHMWFGDLVTMKWWDDLWLNESFATFMSVLSQVSATRFQNAWTTFANSFKSSARRQDQLPSTHPIAADIPDIEAVHLNFDAITYEKGASVLRQLVAWVGQDAFLGALSGYFRTYEWSNADLSQFLEALEKGSGRDLGSWSAEWLETAGLNTLRPALTVADGAYTSVAVVQEADTKWPTLRSHRLAVGLYDRTDEGLERRQRVELDVVGPSTDVKELVGEAPADLVLVNDDDLTYAKIRLDDQSLKTLEDDLHQLTDPLARALCWGAAFDMMRDAEMPARRYLEIVSRNIHGETDIGVVQTLMGEATAAIDTYGDRSNAPAAWARWADRCRAGLEGATPGGDFQLAWARAFAVAAQSDTDRAVVRGLLDGQVPYEGLEVDTDLRWHAVSSLASAGVVDEAVIDAELERDATDMGARHAEAAKAARPSEDAKARAWRQVVDERDLPLATLRAVMGGFQRAEQFDLLMPWATRYFEILDAVWEQRDIDTAIAIARGLYPRVVIGAEVVGMTDEALGRDTLPGPFRRILIEGKDQMERALRARAVDTATR